MKFCRILVSALLAALLLTACAETEFTMPTGEEIAYTVTVLDPLGAPYVGTGVEFKIGSRVVAKQVTDAQGVVTATLPAYTYQVLPITEENYYYNVEGLTLTAEYPQTVIALAYTVGEQTQEVYANGTDHQLHYLNEGNTYVQLQPGKRNYFLFAPVRSGNYRLYAWGVDVGCYGSPQFVQQENLAVVDTDGALCNISESMLGTELVIGVDANQQSSCTLQILRVGDAEKTMEDQPWTEVETTHQPKPFALDLKAGQKLSYVDIRADASDYTAVLGEDGIYRLGSVDGPMLYVNLGSSAPYVSLRQLVQGDGNVGGTAFCKYFFDENGKFVKKEDYTDILCSYFDCLDQNYGIYPLTEDLAYIIQNGGAAWWDTASSEYILTDCTAEIAWLFACCYVQ